VTSYGDLSWEDPFQMIWKEVVVAYSMYPKICLEGKSLNEREVMIAGLRVRDSNLGPHEF